MSLFKELEELQKKFDSDDELVLVSKLRLIQILSQLQDVQNIKITSNNNVNTNFGRDSINNQQKYLANDQINNSQQPASQKQFVPKSNTPKKGKLKLQIQAKNNKTKLQPYVYADVKEWTFSKFQWDSKIEGILLTKFGKENFRPNQRAIINCVLSLKDVFVCMPTGYGKSLTFQIPACVEKGITVVIMPLISLVFDQVTYLNNIGVQAENACGQNRNPKYKDIIRNQTKLIYTTPEKLEKSEQLKTLINQLYDEDLLARFVIDEAHCVSKWGRDFRPDYLKLNNVRTNYPRIPIIALTATAPNEVKDDVIELLQINGCLYLQSSFNRPNLIYQVRRRDKNEKAHQDIKSFIDHTYPRQTGIIYCLSQNQCETLAQALSKLGINSSYYHAGMDELARNKVHQQWMMNEVLVIVATIAFGMGIDKSDCRFVIHYQMPKSIENYYQESGRAGRDGKIAHCILFYSQVDYKINLVLIDKGKLQPAIKLYNIKKLSEMEKYCNDLEGCRRELQLDYLGEKFDRVNCNKTCDNCLTQNSVYTMKDYSKECRSILEFLHSCPQTENQLTTILKGGNIQKKGGKQNHNFDYSLISGILKQQQDDIPQIINQLKQLKFIDLKIVSIGGAKFKSKCVYLSSNGKRLYEFKELLLKVYEKDDPKKKASDDKITGDLFKKYLHKGKQKQSTMNGWLNQDKIQQNSGELGSKEKTYDKDYGFCTQDQFIEIKERIQMERKRIYKKKDEQLSIEFILSNGDIDELCRKLPTTIQELASDFIYIAEEIKKKDYIADIIDEICHFVDQEMINKSSFQIPQNLLSKHEVDQQEVYEFDKFMKHEDYQQTLEGQEDDNQQQYIQEDDVDPDELDSDNEQQFVNKSVSRHLTDEDMLFIQELMNDDKNDTKSLDLKRVR